MTGPCRARGGGGAVSSPAAPAAPAGHVSRERRPRRRLCLPDTRLQTAVHRPCAEAGPPRARSLASSLCSRGHLFSTRPPSPGRPSLVPRDQPFAPGSFGPVTPSAEQLAHALPAPRCPFGRSYFGKTAPASPSAARREASSAPSEAAHLSLSVPLCLPRPRPRRSVTG